MACSQMNVSYYAAHVTLELLIYFFILFLVVKPR